MPEFEYNVVPTPQSLLSIEQMSQCAIQGTNEQGYFYYIVIKTNLGMTTVAECGPVVPDITMLPDGYKSSITRFNYDAKKVDGIIDKWLNDRKKVLTNAVLISEEDALNQFRDVGDYMRNYSNEVY